MKLEEMYSVWAPEDSVWSQWAKPVLFAQSPAILHAMPSSPVDAGWAPSPSDATAIVVDVAGAASVMMGLALAKRGYRPVPLYNAWNNPSALVNIEQLILAIQGGTVDLSKLSIPRDAPPAFLLDAARMDGMPRPGTFDNRWVVFPQDFPSANYLLSQHIRAAVVVTSGSAPKEDLAHVLLRWQQGGVQMLIYKPGYAGGIVPLTVERPRLYRSILHRVMAVMGLRRNNAGGFGADIPLPSSSGGYHGGFG